MQGLALLAVGAAVGIVHVRLAQRHGAVVEGVADGHAVAADGAGGRLRRGGGGEPGGDGRRRHGRIDDHAGVGVGDGRGERLGGGGADALEVAAGDGEALEGHGQLELGDEDGAERRELPGVVVGEAVAVLAGRGHRVGVVAEGEAGEDAAVERAAVVHLDAVCVGRRGAVIVIIIID